MRMLEVQRDISFFAHLLFCAKNIEHIGDFGTDIGEAAVYLATGSTLPAEHSMGRREYEAEAIDSATL
jgi:phosphate transport system protein